MVSSSWYNSNRANLLEYMCVVISTRDAHQNGAEWLVTRCDVNVFCGGGVWLGVKPTYSIRSFS